ncbi:MAG: hypothetical protein SCALA702_30690 [Melioribacteraceae bacterium]|nr:MAG: hypothetical protein SCALA702_30690 [Melioribacteraceae bacterium]
MELIPILSLIILVSTISTFVLAVGAYILYKVRERRGRAAKAKPPESIPAELVEPAQVLTEPRMAKTGEGFKTEEKTGTFAGTRTQGDKSTLFKSTFEDRRTGATSGYTRPTFVTQPTSTFAEETTSFRKKGPETMESERYTGRRGKFMRYTSESENGSAQRENKNKEDNLQWR